MVQIVDDIKMPRPYVKRVRRGMLWPFDKLEIGQGFVVPGDEAMWTEAKAPDGLRKRFSTVHKQASYYGKKWGKKFQVAADKDRSVRVKRVS